MQAINTTGGTLIGRTSRAHIEVKFNDRGWLDVSILKKDSILLATATVGLTATGYSIGNITQYSLNAGDDSYTRCIDTVKRVLSVERAGRLIAAA